MAVVKDDTAVRVEYERLDGLVPHEQNPKAHDVERIKASIRRFGFTNPVVIDERTGVMAAGHGRLIALDEMRESGEEPPMRISKLNDGMWAVPVLRGVHFNSDAERDAYLIADNRLTELGGWDDRSLADMLVMIKETGDAALLEVTGYSADYLNTLLVELQPPKEWQEYGSETSDDVQYITCPHCGQQFPK